MEFNFNFLEEMEKEGRTIEAMRLVVVKEVNIKILMGCSAHSEYVNYLCFKYYMDKREIKSNRHYITEEEFKLIKQVCDDILEEEKE